MRQVGKTETVLRFAGQAAYTRRIRLLACGGAVLALLCAAPAAAQQLPTGGAVAAGSATIGTPQNGTLNVNQSSSKAIINWQSFSVGQGGTVNFNQPNASSATLNRVLGSTPSSIAGTINAPGTVLLVNPNGIAITPTGLVNVGSFAASTLDIKDADFLAGKYTFTGDGGSAGVVNGGRINVSDGGFAALLGGQVANNGIVSARLGKVGLGAGELITLDLTGDGFLQVAVPSSQLGKLVDPNGALVTNRGRIHADGGTVFLSAATAANLLRNAVNMPGAVRANTVGTRDGRIVINGGTGGKVSVTGHVAAKGGKKNAGGKVEVAGAQVNLAGSVNVSGKTGGTVVAQADRNLSVSGTVAAKGRDGKGGEISMTSADVTMIGARLDASGAAGGGAILIGGDYRGGGTLAHALNVAVDADSVFRADAAVVGDGGKIVVWSDGATRVAGLLSARGANGGKGGLIETSGHTLNIGGIRVQTGSGGRWLLDPYDLTVDAAAATTINAALGVGTNVTLQTTDTSASGDGVVNASGVGDITIASALAWSTTATLTLDAYRGININAAVTGANGTLALNAGGAISQTAAGVITIGTLALATNGGNVTLNAATNAVAGLGTVSLGTGALNLKNGVNLALTGAVNAGGGVAIGNTGFIITNAGATITTSNTEIALETGANGTLTINAAVDAGAGNIFLTADNMEIGGVVRTTGSVNIATVTGNRAITLGDAPVPAGLVIGDAGSNEFNQFIGMSAFNVGKTRAGVTKAGDIQFGQATIAADTVNLFTNAGVKQNSPIVFIGATGAGTLNITAVNTVDLRPGVAAGLITGSVSGAGGHFIAYGGGSNINIGPITTNGGDIAVGNNNGTLAVVGNLTSNGGHINAFSTGVLTLGADLDARGATDGSIGLASVAGINQTVGGLFGKDLLAFLCNVCAPGTGNIALDSLTNEITGNVTLVNLTGGNISFTNASAYTVGGISSITYNSIGPFGVAPFTAGLGGPGIRTSGTSAIVTLTAGGDIDQATDADDIIETNTLVVGRMAGANPNVTFDGFDNVNLTSINKVANLGAVSIGQGVFTLYNFSELTITGAATAGGYDVASDGNLTQAAGANIDTSGTNGDIYLTAGCNCSAGTLTLNANVSAGTGGISLEAGDDIKQVAGTITSAGVIMTAGRALTLNANIDTGSTGSVILFANGGAITQPDGAIIAGNMFALGRDGVALDSLSNNFAVVGGASNGDFSATTSRSLTIDSLGVDSNGGSISLTALGAGSDITIPNGSSVGGLAMNVTLNAGRDIVVGGAVFGGSTVSLTAAQDIMVQAGGCGCSGIDGNDVLLAASRDIAVDNVVFAGAKATLLAGRDLTFASSNAYVSSLGSGDAIVLSVVRDFVNNAGAGVLDTSGGGGRWLIYSNSPANVTSGGLDSGNPPVWGTSYPTPVAAAGNRYVFASADPSPPAGPANPPSQVTPPSNNPPNPGVNISFQNPTGGPISISFTPGAAPRTAATSNDVITAGTPDAANRTNNGFVYLPISKFDANQYSQFRLPDYADKAGQAAIFTMIARAVQSGAAADFMIDGFWTGNDGTWAKGSDGKPVANRVTFSDGAGKTVSPTETNGFPFEAGKTDLLALLGKGPVMLGGSGTPATWLLAIKPSDDGKGIIANDPITGRQVLLGYDAGTKTVSGVTGVFDDKTKTFVSLSDAAATLLAGPPVLKADSLAPLNGFTPATFVAVTVK